MDLTCSSARLAHGKKYPLSALQKGLILHTQSHPRTGLYIQQLVCTITAPLDVSLFKAAWRQIIGRHLIFRLILDPTRSQWIVQEEVPFPFNLEDWQKTPPTLLTQKLEARLQADRGTEFPRNTVLFRFNLFRSAPEQFIFVWTSHHAILDGRSRLIVLKEFFSIYESLVKGRKVCLPEPPSLEEPHAGRPKQEQREYWQEYFRGFESMPPIRMKFNEEAAAASGNSHGVLQLKLPPEHTAKLNAFCAAKGLNLNTLLQGAWALLLSRYSNRNDIVFGTTRACRASYPADSRVGLFINTLPMRIRCSEGMPVLEWLRGIRSQWRVARDYESTSLDEIHTWSGLPKEAPLFESIVSFEKYDLTAFPFQKGDQWRDWNFQLRGLTHYPLVVSGVVSGYLSEKFRIELTYSRALFEEALMTRLAGHLERLINELAEYSNSTIDAIPMLSAEEEQRLLVDWNCTTCEYPSECTIPQIFEQRVREAPDSLALVAGSECVSYGQLNSRANQLAREILRIPPERNARIGLYMERSVEAILGFLAILKAGCTCVPIDPALPRERSLSLITEARVGALLVHKATSGKVPCAVLRVINCETCDLQKHPADDLPSLAKPGSVASIMFTSGSTGSPKGAAIRHKSILRLVLNTNYCRFERDEVFFQFAPLSFDASTFEIWGSLLNGAKLVIAPSNFPTLEELGGWIRDYKITTLWLNASLFHEMVDGPIHLLKGVHQLLAGGDRLSPRHVNKFLAEHPSCALINGYGPTENTTFTCCWRILKPIVNVASEHATVPIGRPISNTRVYLLDQYKRLVPVGVPGQLWISGDGLSDGYVNAPELTAKKFLPNPYWPGHLMYDSGDQARFRPDGVLEFLGRVDQQVKIRGFRIEPGEIEEALLQHPKVNQAAVTVHRHSSGEKILVASIVGGKNLNAEHLIEFLSGKLPEPMVPRFFNFLPTIPLNSHGKIDRTKLPSPDLSSIHLSKSIEEDSPRTEIETVLAKIWQAILGVERVGLLENFFSLGGSSLGAMRLLGEIQNSFGVTVTFPDLFEHPTIKSLSKLLEYGTGLAIPTIAQITSNGSEHPLAFKQEGFLKTIESMPNSPFLNVLREIRLKGPLKPRTLQEAFKYLIARHESLRSSFQGSGQEGYRRVIAAQVEFQIQQEDLRALPEAAREKFLRQFIETEAWRRFDFSQSPLMRVQLLRTAEEEYRMILCIHHLACDGWSLRILLSELGEIYSALVRHQIPTLPQIPFQYGHWAAWQRTILQGEYLQKQTAFWEKYLAGPITGTNLPFSKPRPPKSDLRGNSLERPFPTSLSKDLLFFAKTRNVSTFTALGAVYALMLHLLSGNEDVFLNVPVAQRNDPQIQGIVGYISNTIPLRISLSGNPSFGELVRRTQGSLLQALAHANFPSLEMNRIAGNQSNPNPIDQFGFTEVPAFRQAHFHQLEIEYLLPHVTNTFWDFRILVDRPTPEEFVLMFHYRRDLFEPEDIEQLSIQYLAILEKALKTPARSISEFSLEDSSLVLNPVPSGTSDSNDPSR